MILKTMLDNLNYLHIYRNRNSESATSKLDKSK